ncbi:MAG TPA: family 20 glycosylhydrolase [Bryobacteraceae bacterium]
MIKNLMLLLGAAALLLAQPNLMPWPSKIALKPGSLSIDRSFRLAFSGYQEPRLRAAAERFIVHLSAQTGIAIPIDIVDDALQATLEIKCEHAGEPIQKLGEDESYRLDVTEKHARLSAPTPLGVLRGLETFLQLVEPSAQNFAAAAVTIEDKPRFPWRGLHMDVSRHWMPIAVVKRNIAGMAAVKLNVFHWHLSDDQGFRVESKRYPKLQQLGSDGQYYTQEQVREVVEFAHQRGIRVVPEFDVPGHSTSWIVAYPELASAAGAYQIERKWGVFDPTLDPTREYTYEFLDNFIGEMATLFPDQFFHIGGDEVNGKQWKSERHILDFMREHKLKNNQELQAYFNKRIQAIVTKHGKRMEGWDEILNPDLPKDIVIQSWQGQKSLAEAARLGYSGLLSTGYYLDHIEPASVLYVVDPLEKESASLSNEEKSRVLGGEVCMWAEYISAENVDSRIWPRTAAIAERLWSPQGVKDIASMYRRLEVVSRNLDYLGLTHHSGYPTMLERLAGGEPVEPLKVLADVLYPANLGQRTRTHKYTQQTPLTRLVDAVRPESRTAREFAALVDRMDKPQIRAWLTLWRDNDAKLRPTLEKSFLLAEDVQVSKDLSQIATIGLEALDYLDHGKRPPQAWLTRQKAFLDSARKIRQELFIAIVPAIQKLIGAL